MGPLLTQHRRGCGGAEKGAGVFLKRMFRLKNEMGCLGR